MDSYLDWSGHAGYQEAADDSANRGSQHQRPFHHSIAERQHQNFFNATQSQHIPCDIKPRLTKEQHDILENHFQQQAKPNTSTKKGFAESLGVSLDKVNVSM